MHVFVVFKVQENTTVTGVCLLNFIFRGCQGGHCRLVEASPASCLLA